MKTYFRPDMMQILQRIRFAVAWVRWAWRGPYRLGDPYLGTGWLRKQNVTLLRERWNGQEPKLEDWLRETPTEEHSS